MDEGTLPQITTFFDSSHDEESAKVYRQLLLNTLKRVFFSHLMEAGDAPVHICEQLKYLLPLFKFSQLKGVPNHISFYVLCKLRPSAFKFFFELITRWLVPGKRLEALLLNASEFAVPGLGSEHFTICEVMIHVTDEEDLQAIRRNLPMIETEIKLGMQSAYYARRILESKGISSGEKTAILQAYMAYLIKRLPGMLDQSIFTEMQQLLVITNDLFKKERESRHLSRIIASHFLFRKKLKAALKSQVDKRHLFVKIFKANIKKRPTEKPVLGIIIGMNFLKDKEVFDERHLLRAVQNILPQVHLVEGSCYESKQSKEELCLLYLEVEKEDLQTFNTAEINKLRRELGSELRERIEQLMHPIFMPRNDEEVMRNILSLADQLKFLQDTPQVFITFDEQTHTHLFFTIILVRVLKKGSHTIQEHFRLEETFLEYIHDFCKTVGFLRKKYPKEATVFRVRLPKEMFLRNDHSIDLYKARQVVVSELSKVIGEVRDYNGGMITKQNEQLQMLRTMLAEAGVLNEFLIENFFYSLSPAVMRSVHDPQILKNFFLFIYELIELGIPMEDGHFMKVRRESDIVYVIICVEDAAVKLMLDQAILNLNVTSTELASITLKAHDAICIGYLYYSENPEKQDFFCGTLQHALLATCCLS